MVNIFLSNLLFLTDVIDSGHDTSHGTYGEVPYEMMPWYFQALIIVGFFAIIALIIFVICFLVKRISRNKEISRKGTKNT